jgi:hypothetical protein
MTKRSLKQKSTPFTSGSAGSAASKFGQMIGSAFELAVIQMIASYLEQYHPEYEIVQAQNRPIPRLNMFGGESRAVDNIIVPVESDDPVALLETKWLKDGRHHNDKGAWILQLREIRKEYPTIRGTAAILIGFWTNEVAVFMMREGGVEAIRIATDEQVYASLQPHLDQFLKTNTLEPLTLDPERIRDRYDRAWDLANFIQWLDEQGELVALAGQWLLLEHPEDPGLRGDQKVQRAISRFLQSPSEPKPTGWEVTIQIDSGNLIHDEFSDLEELQAFLLRFSDPQNILERITPKKRK